jgi:dipeptidyl-peptidase-4
MKRTLLFALLFAGVAAFAQQKTFNIEQATLGQGRDFAPKTMRGLSWRADLPVVTYIEDGKLVSFELQKGQKTELVSLDALSKEVKQVSSKEFRVMQVSWIDASKLLLTGSNGFALYSTAANKVESAVIAPPKAENLTSNSTKDRLAYTIDDNLYFTDGIKLQQVTTDGGKGIVNGKSVHRNEFGINGGIFWSPKGSYLAFYRMDERMVSEYPIVDITQRVAELRPERYPMAGMASHHVQLGVYNLSTGRTIFLQTGMPDEHYLTNVAWSPDEKYILVAEINRGQNHMKLNKYDAATGGFVKTLFEEKSDRWVEPENPPMFIGKQGSRFIWQSVRDGWNHLYLYDLDGNLIKQLTSGSWDVTGVKEATSDGRYVYFTSTEVSPLERHLFRADLVKGTKQRITSDEGTHSCTINHKAGMVIDQFSSLANPNTVNVLSIDKPKLVRSLLVAPNPYADYKMGREKFIKLKTLDGSTDLYGRIILPADFDSTKKYPTIVYVYGGPHLQLVTNTWLGGARLWEFYMAQKGYIMFTLDNRGTPARGRDFYQAIHRKLGAVDVEDQMQGIAYLKSLPYVDANRIGVHGWSYGGFMTTSLMCKHPEAFKVGVAGAPVIDWKYYEVMYGERYMDTPDENPEGYASASLLNQAKNLKGDLLIIHSDYDVTVLWQNTLMFIKECVGSNVPVDYFIYPQHEHNVRGKDRVHLMTKITKYFDDNLKTK